VTKRKKGTLGVLAGLVTLSTLGLYVGTASASRGVGVAFSIRLEDQFLANLRYLPVRFVPTTKSSSGVTVTVGTTSTTTTAPGSTSTTSTTTTTTTLPPQKKPKATALQKGTFVWRFDALPSALRAQWSVGTNNVILRGALMRFQSLHDLDATGAIDGPTWTALVHAVEKKQILHENYAYVYVSTVQPEKLHLYLNGKLVLTSLVNTGVSDASTALGTYPVYSRFTSTTMSGTEPDGKPYKDVGVPWVSYFNGGDALHGFLRSGYGYPQSLGCVEMPYNDAAAVFPHTPLGTMVTDA